MSSDHAGCACSHPASHVSRRTLIRAGAIGLLGLGMNHVPALRALAASSSNAPAAKAKSVIYIFLSGGLSQIDSFDMKPEGPIDTRGEFKPIRTRTRGVEICEHMPMLARCSDNWALVRSLTHKSNEHSIGHHMMLTGRSDLPVGFDPNKAKETDYPSMAALAGALLPRGENNLPPAIVLPDKIMHTSGRLIPGQFGGQLGKQHDPWFLEMSPYHPEHYGAYPEYLFHHETGAMKDERLSFQAPHLSLPQGLDMRRVLDRVSLRDTLESQSRAYDAAAASDPGFDKYREAAVSLLTNGKVHDAFSVGNADPRWLDRYGRNSFGWSLLIARQLVEVGVNLVQVNLGNDETWDTHQANFPNLKDFLLPPMDRAVSALIEDLDSRGLLDDTLIVMGSEFGRTPKISTLPGSKLPGRDHWGATQTMFFAGGGVRGGTVIGATDSRGAYPVKDPQTPENLAATVFNVLGLPRSIDWHDLSGRPFPLYHADPIKGLM